MTDCTIRVPFEDLLIIQTSSMTPDIFTKFYYFRAFNWMFSKIPKKKV